MTELLDFLKPFPRRDVKPWPGVTLDAEQWRGLAEALPGERWELLVLWGEAGGVHALLRDPDTADIASVFHRCPDGRFASLGAARPGAIRLERAAQDLTGLVAEGLEDNRPWLDHGRWPLHEPLAATPRLSMGALPANAYRFLPVEGEGVHQVPVGPVHAGIIEPGHFRFHANGEAVVRLEERFGYTHKGTLALMRGRLPLDAARLAARVSGDSTVAHSLAFARAVEAATGVQPPPRAELLRGILAELERIANHVGDIGAICNDAAFAILLAQGSRLREDVLRLCHRLFGHRLMMDQVIPGGVANDLPAGMVRDIAALLGHAGRQVDQMARTYDGKPSLLDRTIGTGVVPLHLVQRFAAGGFVGRASGRAFDARFSAVYPPYDQVYFEVPVLTEGDVNARVWIRFREIRESLKLIDAFLSRLTPGPVMAEMPAMAGEGLALVEGFRGEIATWVRLGEDGRVAACFVRDPSWLQWPLLEAAIEGNIIADFPLCNKSFNCSYSGPDL